MALPVPTIDHVVVNVRDRLDEGLEVYRRLGFTMTPRGYHTLGSMNHLAIFGTEYLELIAVAPGPTQRPDIMQTPLGLNGLVFGTDNSAATYEAGIAAGVQLEKPLEFFRPVQLENESRDAQFRTVHLSPGVIPAGRIYFCHHFTRDLVWRDEWRHHANGAIGVERAVIAARDPDGPGSVFSKLFGADAVRSIRGGCRLAVGLSAFDIVTPEEVTARFGDAAPDGEGREQYMVSLAIRTLALSKAAAALADVAGVRRDGGRLVVPAAQAMGAVLVFRE